MKTTISTGGYTLHEIRLYFSITLYQVLWAVIISGDYFTNYSPLLYIKPLRCEAKFC